MKTISNNLRLLLLLTALSVTPIQAITASVSDCFDTNKTMHHSAYSNHHQLSVPDAQHACCETTTCDMTQCAGFVAIAVDTDTQNDTLYTLSEVYANPVESIFKYYPSSLYRPPKA